MDNICINSGNSKTTDPRRVLLNLSEKIKLKRSDKKMFPIFESIIQGKIQKDSCKNNKFKITAPTWNEVFELQDGSASQLND